jgi:serine/threonine protein kinase
MDVLLAERSTPLFRAPELTRARGGPRNATWGSDVWALGVTAYYLLTAQYPFMGDQRLEGEERTESLEKAIRQNPPAPLPASVSPGLRDLIMSMLEKEETDRPQTAEIEVWPAITPGPVVIWRDSSQSDENIGVWFELRNEFAKKGLVFVHAESNLQAFAAIDK